MRISTRAGRAGAREREEVAHDAAVMAVRAGERGADRGRTGREGDRRVAARAGERAGAEVARVEAAAVVVRLRRAADRVGPDGLRAVDAALEAHRGAV